MAYVAMSLQSQAYVDLPSYSVATPLVVSFTPRRSPLIATSTRFATGPSEYRLMFPGALVSDTWFHLSRFVGNNMFCFKWCKDDGSNPDGKCQHTLDRIGTSFNCPSKYTIGEAPAAGLFEVCDSDSFPVPGVYTDSTGATQSYSQPPESLGAISTVPYTPTSAATSNCKTYQSTDLFTAAVATGSASASASGSGSKTGSSGSSPTGTTSSSNSTGSSGTSGSGASDALSMSLFATVVGVLAAVSMFA